MKGEFYKMDFESWDEGTDELTLEQEAAYLRLCHQLYRRKAAIPSSPATLSRIWRCHPNKARKLLADLVEAGKIQEIDGHLSNTRVTRELDDRETRRTQQADAGHTGGTRTQENRRKSLETNDRDQADAGSPAKRNQAEKEREGEKRDQKEASPLSDPRGQSDFPARAFDLWWERQPNKVAKDAARRAFEQIRKSRRATFAELMDGLLRYIATKPPHRDYCHPATWLTGGRWADEPAPASPSPPAGRAAPPAGRSSPGSRLLDRMEARRAEHRHENAEADYGPVLDYEGDARPHRQIHEQAGGQTGRFPSQASLRLVGSGGR